jgi:hypothetical protein
MLPLFTRLLRDFLVRLGVPDDRISLDPPDRDFVDRLHTLGGGRVLDVYLADLRENRRFRTNDTRLRLDRPGTNGHGEYVETPYPAWVDAHYLISAWDSSRNPEDRDRSLREQQLLGAVSAGLLASDPLRPTKVYELPPDAPGLDRLVRNFGLDTPAQLENLFARRLGAWPEEFRSPGLPFQVLPPEGFPKLSDFWTTMGQGSAWRPVVYLVATVPVEINDEKRAPVVTTLLTRAGQTLDAPGRRLVRRTEHTWFQIGGYVTRSDTAGPVPGVRVVLRNVATPARPAVPYREAWSDGDGRFQFQFPAVLPVDERAEVPPDPPVAPALELFAAFPGLRAAPIPVVVHSADPFPHDIVMQPL